MTERRDLPLFAWGNALRAARLRRSRLRRRGAAIALGITALGLTILAPPAPRLVWNASESAPVGLYRVIPGTAPQIGDYVVAWPPRDARLLAARRHYLPLNVPLVKRVAAVAGDIICGFDAHVLIVGRPMVPRHAADPKGRPLPAWRGCRRVGENELFLLMTDAPDSFDGRYFGVTSGRDLVGRATPLWVRSHL